ncbi:MAG: (Fe-S)-binding protein [Thermoproteus sp.]
MSAFDEVYKCVHCGFCLPTCPTYLATGVEGHSPRGRLHLIRAVIEGRANPSEDLLKYIDTCVYCLRCETACPSGVKYGAVYEEFYKKYRDQLQSITFGRYLLAFNVMNTEVGLKFVRALGGAAGRDIKAMTSGEDVGPYVGRTFKAKGERVGRVALFVSPECVAWRYRGEVVATAIRVLTWNGYDVVVPRFSCCGAAYRHSGQFEKAERMAQHNKAVLKEVGPVDAVVVPNSGGCQAELMRYMDGVLDVTQLLAKGLRGTLGPVRMKIAVQHSCHLMNVAKAHQVVLSVLSKIPELKIVPLPSADVCCGGGDIYPRRHRDIADSILEIKRREVAEISPDGVLVESPSCLQQLGRLDVPLYFPTTLLDMSYRSGGNDGYERLD